MKDERIKKNISLIVIYIVAMIAWCLLPPLCFIGGVLQETGEEITSYTMGLNYWINSGLVTPYWFCCIVMILHQIYVIASQIRNV